MILRILSDIGDLIWAKGSARFSAGIRKSLRSPPRRWWIMIFVAAWAEPHAISRGMPDTPMPERLNSCWTKKRFLFS
jgi:hypothetical protein